MPLKEPALSRRHRAPGTAALGASRLANARLALRRSRARIILVLGMACGALLIAAPLALFLSGGPSGDGGGSRDPEGVFTGGPGTGAPGGPGIPESGTGVATESAQSPAPGLPRSTRQGTRPPPAARA
ncbi:hypothetical protein [Blastococcus brunescens]|uniref:Uncharacterized protein n=1 Tax=Blastococcus brunescens TaxID=1564165 RepID=A0ABZ1B3A0_9ACTN|nr:hypothetical protein [Blastococcus sp. BMG 8361]WRL64253.1 hypothetical protein U6N30_32705 [Blastococcus sp. BMG 8361]